MTYLLITIWVVSNILTFNVATLSTISNYNLLIYNAASLEADIRDISETQAREELEEEIRNYFNENSIEDSFANRDRIYQERAVDIISSNPLRYAYLHLKSDLNNLLPSFTDLTEILGVTTGGKGTLAVLNQHGLIVAVKYYFGDQAWILSISVPFLLMLGIIYVSAVVGVAKLCGQKRWAIIIILLLPILYFLIIPGAPSNHRFRVPVMPYISVLSAYGLTVLMKRLRKHKKISVNSDLDPN